ncbi:hypothetical protein IF1G_11122 [Cordyceps javanica]|uniref:Uncharacterized protein n=1 Tax=Cordyceps javanica TaxID=43265 RepID=A0A545VIX1_9HYPO|nr:hypothetical protein IF1G_11122 [Cordyceps javanica]TQW01673.1 hypothetical protein IF2G_10814 [Cordyceps javanica]
MPSSATSGHGLNELNEFYKLKTTTQLYIEDVYNTMLELKPGNKPEDSYTRLIWALDCLGVVHFEYNPKSHTTSKILVAQRVHQQTKDAKVFMLYGDNDFNLPWLTELASCRNWGVDDLKIIAAKWMSGKDEATLLKPGRKFLEICKAHHEKSKAHQTAGKVLPSATETAMASSTAQRKAGDRPRQHSNVAGADDRVPPMDGGKRVTKDPAAVNPTAVYLEDETLGLIRSVTDAHQALGRRTAELVAHLLQSEQQKEPSGIPPHKRIEAPQPVDYPWRNKRKPGRRQRRS